MNAFAELAERQIANPVKAKARAKEKRAESAPPQTAAEKAMREQAKLLSNYRRAHRDIWRAALQGPHGARLASLKRALRRFGPSEAGEFVAFVETLDWPRAADPDTRQLALRLIGTRIERIRESVGLSTYDDALPGEPDCAWVRCRRAVMGN